MGTLANIEAMTAFAEKREPNFDGIEAMIDRPDAAVLLEAMAATLTDTVMPELSVGAQHQARIVANLCRIVARDLADDATDTTAALTALLGAEGSLNDLAAVLTTASPQANLDEALPLLLADAARRAEIAKAGYTDDTTEQIAMVSAISSALRSASPAWHRWGTARHVLHRYPRRHADHPAVAQVSASVLGSVPASAEAAMLRLAERSACRYPPSSPCPTTSPASVPLRSSSAASKDAPCLATSCAD